MREIKSIVFNETQRRCNFCRGILTNRQIGRYFSYAIQLISLLSKNLRGAYN